MVAGFQELPGKSVIKNGELRTTGIHKGVVIKWLNSKVPKLLQVLRNEQLTHF